VKGRKLHALVDTEGLPLRVIVHSAGLQERWLGFPLQRFGSVKWLPCRLIGTSLPMLWRHAGRA